MEYSLWATGHTEETMCMERLSIPPEEVLEEVSGEWEQWTSLLRLLTLRPGSRSEKGRRQMELTCFNNEL